MSVYFCIERYCAKLCVFILICIMRVFVYGPVFIFVLPDSYIAKSASLPGYGRNELNRVSRND